MSTGEVKRVEVAPDPSTLIESLRDIGYSLPTAVADTMDNSIAAGAREIDLLADTVSDAPAIGILDDGCGMSPSELREAMRLGVLGPLARRGDSDLGRFGLGMKTAAFSQCRRLTLLTSQRGRRACGVWDLDTVTREGRWYLEEPQDHDGVRWAGRLPSTGTLVVWENLDRLSAGEPGFRHLVRQLTEAEDHLSLVFHRFLAGTHAPRTVIRLNGRALRAHDPFHPFHPATQFGPEEVVRLKDIPIRIQPVTLPHHSKLTSAEWEKGAGADGYFRNQGFYLYRNHRLIIHGTWLGLARQTALTKLSRVSIDIPNALDAEWRIDIRKSSAQLPPTVRTRLRRILEGIQAPSRRTFTGRTVDAAASHLAIWKRTRSRGSIRYGLDQAHPVVEALAGSVKPPIKRRLLALLNLIETALPLESLRLDLGNDPNTIRPGTLDERRLRENLTAIYRRLAADAKLPGERIEPMLRAVEPFRSNWSLTQRLLREIAEAGGG